MVRRGAEAGGSQLIEVTDESWHFSDIAQPASNPLSVLGENRRFELSSDVRSTSDSINIRGNRCMRSFTIGALEYELYVETNSSLTIVKI
jgi:hypothetical protein